MNFGHLAVRRLQLGHHASWVGEHGSAGANAWSFLGSLIYIDLGELETQRGNSKAQEGDENVERWPHG